VIDFDVLMLSDTVIESVSDWLIDFDVLIASDTSTESVRV